MFRGGGINVWHGRSRVNAGWRASRDRYEVSWVKAGAVLDEAILTAETIWHSEYVSN